MSVSRTVEWEIESAWEPYDCETCGYAVEHCTISWDGHSFSAQAAWGCYHGESIYDADFMELAAFFSDDLPEGFLSRQDIGRVLREAGLEANR